ncbi:[FeFe] hydrogenase H-cluster maturation GTPase HydF [Butyricicoccus pullicaecorum]|uniref:[FeFe] hydrogenase H-cluster maturation GTPase HydF n=1 Tax=Butyricicoccus pullicaecorum 1.2 TaxID=1203606 RepID=R8W5C3_9FIRM|nr:[FeFe] hydrogenase H-cluster maturation GTPase HydF [Butyricicoccus pullicaecorum]EOQ40058.1 [FeFe] hydrogenase H-cluster maturation GTPase HydF [Butyricicoccus pullicaecorum 1.2]SKA68346.1 [FeFe] hydrogenase H-cluster maturation GTPase HydF [Butyricicoccus pullicaecorum DSM 23266]
MSMNDTPSSERIHIGFFGRRNAGKSSLVNAVTGQQLSVVSEVKGTTTDPVQKAMELLPMGPVVIIDTPGFDDEGQLGELRVQQTKRTLNRVDCAVLVVDGTVGKTAIDEQIIQLLMDKNILYIVAYNKADLGATAEDDGLAVSALTGDGVWELKERVARLVKTREQTGKLVGDLVRPGDVLILVVPIDKSAPKGRLILPQQQVIRDTLEAGAMPMVTRETEYPMALERLGRKPALVVTDSQVFGVVSKATPEDVPLTSFSILMARYKGFLEDAVRGAAALNALQDGDRILIAEGCTHHRQCEDIGTVKLPRWLREYSGADLQFDTCSGREFPEDLSPCRLVVHCGGCMLNGRELDYRRKCAADSGVPFTNYGTAIAQVHGILKRSLEKFPSLAALLP